MPLSAGAPSPDPSTNPISPIACRTSDSRSARTLASYDARQTIVADAARRADETTLAGHLTRFVRFAADGAAPRCVVVSLGRRRTQRANRAVRQCGRGPARDVVDRTADHA